MEKQDYTAVIMTKKSQLEAIKAINNVAAWWAEDIEGNTEKPGDEFTVHFGETFVTFNIVEVIPEERIEWLVTDCYLPWLKDKTEWNATRVRFEISEEHSETKILFTHVGLVPQVECYNDCVKGWDQYIKGSLLSLINEGVGQPQKKKKD